MKSKWLFFNFLTLYFADIHAGTSGAELGAPLLDPIGDLPAVDRQGEVHVANGPRVGLSARLEGHPWTVVDL
jgi:hypothetical protein